MVRDEEKDVLHISILTPVIYLYSGTFKINLKLKFPSHITREFLLCIVAGKLKCMKTTRPTQVYVFQYVKDI